MSTSKKEKNQPIQVFVRVRPINKNERCTGSLNMIEIRGNRELIVKNHINPSEKYNKIFTYDQIFSPQSKQIDVYKMVAEPTVSEVIAGYNCTVFAYGQTGTGKTYTMAGGNPEDSLPTAKSKMSWQDDVHAGIIPRTLSHLFDKLRIQYTEFTVRVSYLELYNEEIFDLLSSPEDGTKLKLYDDTTKKGSVIVQGLTEMSVCTKSEVYKILERGAEKRRTASTLMNAQSSRSHTVFCVTVHTKESSCDGEDLLKTGKLYLVDLAGSENVKQSGATDKRAREACSINQSLLTLGRCIVALTEHRAHVPYRESKLTRLLQDSLGGRTKTSLIATISPAFCNIDETLSTLDYASRAKYITNKPEINQRLSKQTLLKEYVEEIDRLRRDLAATRLCHGVYMDTQNYEGFLAELELQRQEINEKIGTIRALNDEKERMDQLCIELKISLEKRILEVEKKIKVIDELENKLEQATEEITTLQEQKEEKEFLVERYSESEHVLHNTAKKLLTVAESSASDAEKLYNKLDVMSDINKQNKVVVEQYVSEHNYQVQHMKESLEILQRKHDHFTREMLDLINNFHREHIEGENTYKLYRNCLMDIAKTFTELIENDNFENKNFINLSDKAEQEMNKLFQSDIKSLKELWEFGVFPVFTNFVNFIEKQHNNIDHVYARVKQEIVTNSQTHTDGMNYLKLNLLKANEDIADTMNKINEDLVKHYTHNLNVTLDQDKQQKEILSLFEIAGVVMAQAKHLFCTYNGVTSAQNQSNLSHWTKISADVVNCENKVEALCKSTSEGFSVSSKEIDAFTKSVTNILEEEKCNVTIQRQIFNERENALDTAIQNIVFCASDKLQNHKLEYTNRFRQQCDVVNQIYKGHSKTAEEFSQQITRLYSDYENISAQMCKKTDVFTKTANDSLMKNKDSCIHDEVNLTQELEVCRERFKKLFNTNMREYKSTGMTPIRKQYKYPKYVPSTMAKELVLRDFYKKKVKKESQEKSNDEGIESGINETTIKQRQTHIPMYIRSASESNISKVIYNKSEGNKTLPLCQDDKENVFK